MRSAVKLLAGLLFAILAITGCRPAISHPDWSPDVRKALNDFVASELAGAGTSYVVFDFDNTCSIFDISEQLMIYQLETMSFNLDPSAFAGMALAGMDPYPEARGQLEGVISAYSYLYGTYGPFTSAGVGEETASLMHEDPLWRDFAIDMASMYDVLQEYMTIDEAYIWVLGWFAGMSGEEVYDLALRSHQLYSSVPTAVRSWKGSGRTYSWTDGIAVSDNIMELWKVLKSKGIDIWVCSASEIRPVMAAVDFFGLHEYCTGVLAMTMALDSSGRYLPQYDYSAGTGYLAVPGGGWEKDTVPTRVQTSGPGKVAAIRECLVPRYGGKGPSAGFMDSTGDFNFCTEFASMRLCVCFNRASRKVTDGGGLIAEVAMYEKETLHYDLKSALSHGDILYVLQGRDENGLRRLRPSNSTLRLGETSPRLFCSSENSASLEYFKENKLSVKEILETFCLRTPASDPSNPLGFKYGFLDRYDGYRSKE